LKERRKAIAELTRYITMIPAGRIIDFVFRGYHGIYVYKNTFGLEGEEVYQ